MTPGSAASISGNKPAQHKIHFHSLIIIIIFPFYFYFLLSSSLLLFSFSFCYLHSIAWCVYTSCPRKQFPQYFHFNEKLRTMCNSVLFIYSVYVCLRVFPYVVKILKHLWPEKIYIQKSIVNSQEVYCNGNFYLKRRKRKKMIIWWDSPDFDRSFLKRIIYYGKILLFYSYE